MEGMILGKCGDGWEMISGPVVVGCVLVEEEDVVGVLMSSFRLPCGLVKCVCRTDRYSISRTRQSFPPL